MSIWDKLTRFVLVLVLVAMGLMIVIWYLPLIQQNERMRKEVLRLQTELARERDIHDQLLRAIEAQRNDPRTVERMARERLGLAKPDETVIRFEEPVTNPVATGP